MAQPVKNFDRQTTWIGRRLKIGPPEAGIAITVNPALRYTLWIADLGSLEASGHLAFAPSECCGKHYENTGMAKMNFTGSSGDCSA
ncbi:MULTISPECIES: hypothetical protein [Mesorhizobium]|uniref:hypothetical protein n=1 Tax=Mesorhizobium TaxID=68287 RepID=UPI0012EC29E3|nr:MULTISPECIES: hypothetical protein [Mesorhizobium]WJI38762.1 hypothetical protein NL534_00350 [Mesorhizobium opportunistum]